MDTFEFRAHKELVDEATRKVAQALANAESALTTVGDHDAVRFWLKEAIEWHRHCGDSLYVLRSKSR